MARSGYSPDVFAVVAFVVRGALVAEDECSRVPLYQAIYSTTAHIAPVLVGQVRASALNSAVNERCRRGFFPTLSMIGHPSGAERLMVDVCQTGQLTFQEVTRRVTAGNNSSMSSVRSTKRP